MTPMGISQNRIARDIGVSPRRINEIVHGRSYMERAPLRPTRHFVFRVTLSTSEGFWMGLQADYELEEARNHLGSLLQKEVRPHAA